MKSSPAYTALRDLGMRPALARHFLVGLRCKGFVLVKEKELTQANKINRQIEVIVKLMKAGKGRL